MLGFFYNWSCLAKLTLRIYQLIWLQEFGALFALIPFAFIVLAEGASALDVSVCQKCLALFTVALVHCFFFYHSIIVQIKKDVLSNFCMIFSRSSAKHIKIYIKPLIHLRLNGEIFLANLLWCHSHLSGLHLSGRTIFICSTHVDGIITHQSTES